MIGFVGWGSRLGHMHTPSGPVHHKIGEKARIHLFERSGGSVTRYRTFARKPAFYRVRMLGWCNLPEPKRKQTLRFWVLPGRFQRLMGC